jgi:hypothetical protein
VKVLLIGASLLALTVPGIANAQTSVGSTGAPVPGEVAQGRYLVFFDLGRSELTSEARRVVAEAAESYRQTGRARVDVTGYTDTSGSPARNQRLSEQRAQAVEVELVQQGVPASSITVSGRGQNDLLVPTADGVRQPENRRVEIVVTQPEPAPVAVAPEPVEPPPPPPEPEPDHFLFALGPVYGHNFGEDDADGGDKTQSDMAGVELTFNALPGFLGGVSLKQMALWSLNSTDDGLAGRSVASVDFAPDLGIFRPALSLNFGGIYGNGVQNGFVAGPEIGFDVTLIRGFTVGLKAAYDYQFRNAGWDEGIVWGGLDLGIRF